MVADLCPSHSRWNMPRLHSNSCHYCTLCVDISDMFMWRFKFFCVFSLSYIVNEVGSSIYLYNEICSHIITWTYRTSPIKYTNDQKMLLSHGFVREITCFYHFFFAEIYSHMCSFLIYTVYMPYSCLYNYVVGNFPLHPKKKPQRGLSYKSSQHWAWILGGSFYSNNLWNFWNNKISLFSAW